MRFILIVLGICCVLHSNGQEYVPFISTQDSSDTWSEIVHCIDQECFITTRTSYSIDGDTIINELEYSKVLRFLERIEEPMEGGTCEADTLSYFSHYYMREENKRIYVIISFFNESLSYDFNLSVGDTVPNPALGPSNEDARIIDAIDEIEINGTIRQQFHLSGGAYIIEGIGASTGLFSRVSEENGCSSEMTCYQEEGTTFHFNSDCDFYLNVEEELAPALERKLIKIVNLQGQEVEPQPNQIHIYLYSDGSAEKKVYIE